MDINDTTTNHAVIYTDGSFLATDKTFLNGYSGGGVHGYIYNSSTLDQEPKLNNQPDDFKISTQGYQRSVGFTSTENRKLVNPHSYIDIAYAYGTKFNNVMAELQTVTNALIDILNKVHNTQPISTILILTDSNYVIYCLDTIQNKDRTSWDNDKQKNRELILELYNIYQTLLTFDIQLSYLKVEAHSGVVGNELADKLAYFGREQSKEGMIHTWFNLTSNASYWTTQDRHPLLRYRQLFFTNSIDHSAYHPMYSVMEYSTTMQPGKKTHDACFGLISLHNHQQLIEDAITTYHNLGNDIGRNSVVSTLNLNSLFHHNTLRYYNLFGNKSFNFYNRLAELRNLTNTPLVYSIQPAGLALQALERMNILYTIIDEFNKGKHPTKIRTFFNITNQIYNITQNKKGKTIYDTIPENGINQFKVKVNHNNRDITLLLDLGKDTLSRNQFKALQKDQPEVWLVLDQEPSKVPTVLIYRYYTIIKTIHNDIGIFCNFYSGIHLINTTKEK